MRRFLHDFIRVGILMVFAGVALYLMDESNIVVLQALLIGIFLVGGTHLIRRVLFPRIDLQSIAKTSIEENNISAAIIFASIILLLIAVMFLSMSTLK